MFNLLPQDEKQKIMRQYKSRRMVVILLFSFFIFLSGAIFLLPSYILTLYREREVLVQAKIVENVSKGKNKAELVGKIKALNEKIRNIKASEVKIQYYDIIQKVLEKKSNSITVNSFLVMDKAVEKGNLYQVQMTGVAKTRDELVDFEKALDSIPGLEAELPVSSLASEINAEFVINITLTI